MNHPRQQKDGTPKKILRQTSTSNSLKYSSIVSLIGKRNLGMKAYYNRNGTPRNPS